ncbi:hypothetical protein FRAAL1030 [Frankia alni ACN14a]|uniref:Uncharacterized protein n=1 Tax=Frankia alni (strain DSM 45986 / CECT 9034 / ACN14a) TaxID=326424 RepID=Q0RRX0_FRAAA|nr:hypothetical protein FRAAL1030 [Frankia alni ACN14a]
MAARSGWSLPAGRHPPGPVETARSGGAAWSGRAPYGPDGTAATHPAPADERRVSGGQRVTTPHRR